MTNHAQGTFTVKMEPLTPAPAEGLARYSLVKTFDGDLQGHGKGEMLSGGNPQEGAAGYVAIEVITGTLNGKQGSFALQHLATMDQSGRKMTVIVVPGSGTGELKAISGTFHIENANNQHSYTLEYSIGG